MKQITRDMLKIYKPYSEMDWLNYKIVRNDMTAHHIVKKEHGGKLEMDNIALLLSVSHSYLHIIEYKDLETYIAINKIFKYVNQQKHEPTIEQRAEIECLLHDFEVQHEKDKGRKNTLLIKKKFLERCRF
jgi:hypothetical protein